MATHQAPESVERQPKWIRFSVQFGKRAVLLDAASDASSRTLGASDGEVLAAYDPKTKWYVAALKAEPRRLGLPITGQHSWRGLWENEVISLEVLDAHGRWISIDDEDEFAIMTACGAAS